jgi:catechol 2,3-dioxygenase-like lactoylglutathione lyase family enzyme
MLDHVTIRVSDRDASRRFYTVVLGEPSHAGADFDEWKDFSLTQADDEHPVTRHLHVAFAAPSQEDVDAFWQRGVDAGYPSDGEPGLRTQYHPDYYGGFLLDPDGNSVESCTGFREGTGGPPIDHLWLGVRDLAASRRFWETVAPVLSLNVTEDRGTRFHVWAGDRSLALVADGRPPVENLHLAVPVASDEAVAEFHRVATSAGYRDNGPPGERTQYHPGYVGAFVLDPDGNNIEAVNHNRR